MFGILIISAIIFLTGCPALIPPIEPPSNPNDENNPVAALDGFGATTESATSIRLVWNATYTGDTAPAGVFIIRKKDEPPVSRTDGIAVAAVLADGEFLDEELDEGATYWYSAWTHNADESHFTGPISVNASTFSLVTGFAATTVDTTKINLTWTLPASNPPAGIIVVRNTTATPLDPDDGTLLPAILSAASYEDTGLTPGTTYNYAMWTYEDIDGAYAGPMTDDAATDPVPILANFTATANSDTEIEVTWTTPNPPPDEVKIRIKAGSAPTSPGDVGVDDSADLTDAEITAASHVFDFLTPNTVYYVSAWCYDVYDNETVPLESDASTVPEVTNLFLEVNSATSVTINWTVPGFAPDSIVIRRGTSVAPADPTEGTSIPATLGIETVTDTSISAGATYQYSVFSESGGYYAGPQIIQVAPFNPVTGFVADATSSSSVELTWSVPGSNPPPSILVIRSMSGFTTDPTELSGITNPTTVPVNDPNSLLANTVWYYSLWSYDQYLNYSAVSQDTANTSIGTANILPSSDGYVASWTVSSTGDILVGSSTYFGLFDFNIGSLDSYVTSYLQSAIVSVYRSAPADSYTRTIRVYGITTAWSLAESYNTLYPKVTNASNLTAANVDDSIDYQEWGNWDVTGIVADWILGSVSGLRMNEETSWGTANFASKDSPTFEPYLQLQWDAMD